MLSPSQHLYSFLCTFLFCPCWREAEGSACYFLTDSFSKYGYLTNIISAGSHPLQSLHKGNYSINKVNFPSPLKQPPTSADVKKHIKTKLETYSDLNIFCQCPPAAKVEINTLPILGRNAKSKTGFCFFN